MGFTLILILIFVLRLPSLFEPFWYGDEGIFAAVARNLNLGGTLYATAWDNKPPMIYLTYAAIFKTLGVSMFWLRMAAMVAVLATGAVIYEIAQKVLGVKRALFACAIFGVLTSLRLVEGNLALTEIFMILPISLAMLLAIKRNCDYPALLAAGILLATASLYKQVGALEAAALGLFLFLYSPSFWGFFKKGLALTLGFAIPYGLTLGYFGYKNLIGDYIFAAYTYYNIYLSESPQYARLLTVAKFLPIAAVLAFGFWKKRKGEVNFFHLFLLWGALAFLGSFFSGRTYGHYLIQAIPALSLIVAAAGWPRQIRPSAVIFAAAFILPMAFLTKTFFWNAGGGNLWEQTSYYKNFFDYTLGKKSVDDYNNYFDRNVNLIMETRDFLEAKEGFSKSVYIWGDWAWLYAIADSRNPSRYVTSFHVFGVPEGREEVIAGLAKSPPVYIIKAPSSIGYFAQLEKVLKDDYTLTLQFDSVQIFGKKGQE